MDLDIEGLKSRLDIVDIVEKYVPLKKSGKNYFGFCPFHNNTKTQSFTVEPSKQFLEPRVVDDLRSDPHCHR